MKLPRDLSGEDLIKHLCKRWGYQRVHVILETEFPGHQRIAVPAHTPLRIGTLNAILAAVAAHKGATKEEILRGI